ncbi:hypothetical protein [Saccharothrix variisporea]|uniref:hypothetical protein n=1 Tax=Saccharothrix variisporea TaxID=543527 RepID=UPI000EADD0B4
MVGWTTGIAYGEGHDVVDVFRHLVEEPVDLGAVLEGATAGTLSCCLISSEIEVVSGDVIVRWPCMVGVVVWHIM